MKRFVDCCIVCLAFAAAAPVVAAPIVFVSNLTPDQVVPANGGSPGSGYGIFTLVGAETANPTLEYFLHIDGLDLGPASGGNPLDLVDSNDVSGIHLHVAPVGQTGAIGFGIFDLLIAAADQDADGPTFDVANGNLWGVWDANVDSGISVSSIIEDLLAGNIYVQVHSLGQQSPNAEIRGQLYLAPEPGSFAIWILAGLGAGYCFARQRKSALRAAA